MARFTYLTATPPPPRISSRAALRPPVKTPEVVRQRSLPRAADGLLSPLARGWFEALAMRPRPEHLCARYPRVANRVALCWGDAQLTAKLFDDLLVDHRGGRKGFPPLVLAELRLLNELNETRVIAGAAARAGPWAHVELGTD